MTTTTGGPVGVSVPRTTASAVPGRRLRDVRYLLATGLPAVVATIAVVAGWSQSLLTGFWSGWSYLMNEQLAPLEMSLGFSVGVETWAYYPAAWLLIGGGGLTAFLTFARLWAPVVHERTAWYLGDRAPAPLSRLSGGARARTVAFLTGAESWRRAGWAVVHLALCGVAVVPLGAAVDGLRGLAFWFDWNHSLYFVNLLCPETVAIHLHENIAAWLAASLLELTLGLAWLLLVVPLVARRHAAFTAAVLRPDPGAVDTARLAARVDDLTRTRAGAVDAHSAELRRIERDLHDGTQARLVDVTMRLGMAERAAGTDPAAVVGLVRDARTSTEDAMTELRTVLRTLYPPVLADRGLHGALSGLGARCTVPTAVDVDPDLGPLSAPVEAAAYYLVAESLTNVVKHSGAGHTDALVTRSGDALRIRVTDDGLGGVDETRGTGVAGMRRRVEALDGWLDVTSPPGGPTILQAEIPCGS